MTAREVEPGGGLGRGTAARPGLRRQPEGRGEAVDLQPGPAGLPEQHDRRAVGLLGGQPECGGELQLAGGGVEFDAQRRPYPGLQPRVEPGPRLEGDLPERTGPVLADQVRGGHHVGPGEQ
nr:hypothetical protein [Streptomyces sp. NRRL S-495]